MATRSQAASTVSPFERKSRISSFPGSALINVSLRTKGWSQGKVKKGKEHKDSSKNPKKVILEEIRKGSFELSWLPMLADIFLHLTGYEAR